MTGKKSAIPTNPSNVQLRIPADGKTRPFSKEPS
ncbi:hypothetical protein CLV67_13759 [Actinoplanes italicus]|uniref:Uncharacterized protein n=1 Tax=Actinoplanes italicus TaxID=113567 RepID=A0A2T0JNH8_9ACTN|nr:hypothetical protein CLV67_13759 [Actinoplanes italicus]